MRIDKCRRKINGMENGSDLGVEIGLKLRKRRDGGNPIRQDSGCLSRHGDQLSVGRLPFEATHGWFGLDIDSHHFNVRIITLLLRLQLHRVFDKGIHNGLNLRAQVISTLLLELKEGKQFIPLLASVNTCCDVVLSVVLQKPLGKEERIHATVHAVGLLGHLCLKQPL